MAKRVVDGNQRRAEIAIALLFVITAIAAIVGGNLYEPILNAPDYLSEAHTGRGAIALGALVVSINNIGIIFIAVSFFPLLQQLDKTMAAGYLAVRVVEGTLMMVGIAATLLVIPLSEAFTIAGPQASWFVALGGLVKAFKELTLSTFSTVLLGLGGLILSWLLFRFRLVPRLLSAFGLLSYVLILLAGIGAWFDLIDMAGGGPTLALAAPVALFEIVLMPAWLVFRGLDMPRVAVPEATLDAR